VAGEKGEAGIEIAVGDGDAGVGRGGDAGGDAGDFDEGDVVGAEDFGFFAAATEDVGIAAFEADNDFSFGVRPSAFGVGEGFAGFFDEDGVDFILGFGVLVGGFADVDFFGVGGGEFEEVGVGEVVVDDDIGAAEGVGARDGDQAGIAGTSAHQINHRLRVHRFLLTVLSFARLLRGGRGCRFL